MVVSTYYLLCRPRQRNLILDWVPTARERKREREREREREGEGEGGGRGS